MRESVGQSALLKIVMIFIVLYVCILAVAVNYSITFRVKNNIVKIIEEYEGIDNALPHIEEYVKNITYYKTSISTISIIGSNEKCPNSKGQYCISEISSKNGVKYKATVYVSFSFPVVGRLLNFPISGDTKEITGVAATHTTQTTTPSTETSTADGEVIYVNYNVVYNGTLGIGSMPNQVCTTNKACKLNKNTFTYEREFLGWARTSDGDVKYSDEQTIMISNPDVLENGNLNLYAKWDTDKCFNFTYTGDFDVNGTKLSNTSYELSTDLWKVKFLTSGTLSITCISDKVDMFLVGGGGAGAGISGTWNGMWTGGAGGGGGYTTTALKQKISIGSYNIVVGSGGIGVTGNSGTNGGASIAFGYTAAGGYGGEYDGYSHPGADGGSGGGGSGEPYNALVGGNGGSNGSNGKKGKNIGGSGQGKTTREFGDADGKLYAGGGGAAGALGGAGGGGAGANYINYKYSYPTAGEANTGGGGGGNFSIGSFKPWNNGGEDPTKGGDGGSGIVILRSSQTKFIVELNGGTTTQSFAGSYTRGFTITLVTPKKEGSTFTGWTVSGTGAKLNGNKLTFGTGEVTLTAHWNEIAAVTYTGKFTVDGTSYENTTVILKNENWEIKFLTSGYVTMVSKNKSYDIFLVGGGGAGGGGCGYYQDGLGGGGGGYTTTAKNVSLSTSTKYIKIGSGGVSKKCTAGGDGGTSSAFGYTAAGGQGGSYLRAGATPGGAGGSGGGGAGCTWKWGGGLGGSDGSNGADGLCTKGGTGQGTTTRSFEDANGDIYAYGGSGGWQTSAVGSAGNGTGTVGYTLYYAESGKSNTGSGGGGAVHSFGGGKAGGNGGSGIVIIRNAR